MPNTESPIYSIKVRIQQNFTGADWFEIGVLTGYSAYIENHPRLLRSLNFQDDDYPSNVIEVINRINREQPDKINHILDYLDENYPDQNSQYISSQLSVRKITFAPSVFKIPSEDIDNQLVSLMMPFGREFDPVASSIKDACSSVGFTCLRADDIWETSTIIDDIFSLIFRSKIVIVDHTRKNPNVMYETGISHTLGKIVIPITQSLADVPFDMSHHRALIYLNNDQGLTELRRSLTTKLVTYR